MSQQVERGGGHPASPKPARRPTSAASPASSRPAKPSCSSRPSAPPQGRGLPSEGSLWDRLQVEGRGFPLADRLPVQGWPSPSLHPSLSHAPDPLISVTLRRQWKKKVHATHLRASEVPGWPGIARARLHRAPGSERSSGSSIEYSFLRDSRRFQDREGGQPGSSISDRGCSRARRWDHFWRWKPWKDNPPRVQVGALPVAWTCEPGFCSGPCSEGF